MKLSKQLLFASLVVSASALTVSSCSDDDNWKDVDSKAPSISLDVDAAHTEPGMDITIKGLITDADGISTIKLECPELYLDKTIDIIAIYGEPLKEYRLEYSMQTTRHLEGENFVVKVTVTDIGGRQQVQEFGANLDADFTAPYFTAAPGEQITVLIKNQTAIKLNVEIADNRVVDYAVIDLKKVVNGAQQPVDGFPLRIEGGDKTLSYNNSIPVANEPATYKLTIEAADREVSEPAHVITSESTITVTELPDFDEIYLADVASASELNSDVFGCPIAMDHVGAYKYRVIYYNEKAGTEIAFLGQKTDFGPICFAPSKENPAELGDDPDEVDKIKLDQAETYYSFLVDTWNRTYTVSTYGISQAVSPVSHQHYGENELNTWVDWTPGAPWWQEWYFGPATGPDNVTRMEQDSKNPNIFYCYNMTPANFESDGNMKFIVHNWHSHGWWNYTTWRCDNSAEPSKFEYYGNVIPDNELTAGNADYFNWKYLSMNAEEYAYRYPNAGGAFDMDAWGSSEDYRKRFVPDNWVNTPMPSSGKYVFKIDVHAERGWMYKE